MLIGGGKGGGGRKDFSEPRRCEPPGGSGGMFPREILANYFSEMPMLRILGVILKIFDRLSSIFFDDCQLSSSFKSCRMRTALFDKVKV